MMLLCDNCINAIRSRGEIVGVIEPYKYTAEDCEELGISCEWCGEVDELSDCTICGDLY